MYIFIYLYEYKVDFIFNQFSLSINIGLCWTDPTAYRTLAELLDTLPQLNDFGNAHLDFQRTWQQWQQQCSYKLNTVFSRVRQLTK